MNSPKIKEIKEHNIQNAENSSDNMVEFTFETLEKTGSITLSGTGNIKVLSTV